jgi:methyl-accepting chemotaxis protein
MKGNWTIGRKLAMGFGVIIAMVLALGILAIWSMTGVKITATHLQEDNVPEVVVATQVERYALHTIYGARGYAFTEDTKYLDDARANLEKVKSYLKEAKELAAKRELKVLKENADKAEAKALEYEGLLNKTVEATNGMKEEKEKSLKAAEVYIKQVNDFMELTLKKISEQANAANFNK